MVDMKFMTQKLISFLLFCCCLFFQENVWSQVEISTETKFKQAGLVWGLLKYHHPEISTGRYDWDSQLISLFDELEGIKTQEEMNILLLKFISQFKTDKLEKKGNKTDKLFLKNIDYEWIDKEIFGTELTSALEKIKENKKIKNYYASTNALGKILSFKNEKGFKDFNYKLRNHRLLLLYNFWNAVQYWNVNKYLMDERWFNCLDSMTKEFLNCKTNLEFELIKSKLIAKLNDSHAYYLSTTILDSLYKYRPAFSVKAINDSLLISAIYNRKLAEKDGIELGDIIVKIDGNDISSCFSKNLAPILSASNSSFLSKFSQRLLFKETDRVNVDLVRKDGARLSSTVQLYSKFDNDEPIYINTEKLPIWTFIKPNIGYVNLAEITKKELKNAFKELENTKGLIIDLRNYPKNISEEALGECLYPDRKKFIKVLFPVENMPSLAEYDGDAPLKLVSDPFKSGNNNSDYYKGKIVLLVNKTTISRAEYLGMIIQQAPNCTTIGEQTAGAVMNVVNYVLSDKTEINFTSMGAFYPNDQAVQRQGLHIDYYINESAKNYDPEAYLKYAIKIVEYKI